MSIATEDDKRDIKRIFIGGICIFVILAILTWHEETYKVTIECPQGYKYIIPNEGDAGCYAFAIPVKKPIQP